VTRRIAVLVNPTSGKGRGARLSQPVADSLREAGLEP
jgi:diacylglycerol kinase (ATP)